MNVTNKDRIKIIDKAIEELNKMDTSITLSGFQHLVQVKQYMCLLKTSIYVEEQINEDKIN